VQIFADCLLNYLQEAHDLQMQFANYADKVVLLVLMNVQNTIWNVAKDVQRLVKNVRKLANANNSINIFGQMNRRLPTLRFIHLMATILP
jgi:hypothetical protein